MTTPDIEFDRGLPASIDAERSILGAILLDNEAVWEAAETLKTTDFALGSHMKIYSAMVRMAEAGTAIDIVTLSEDLGQFREVDAVGGVAYLFSLTEGLPRRLSIAEYVKIVKDRAQLRVLIRECSMASRRAQDMQDAAADIIADLQDRMLEEQAEGESSAVKIGDVAPTIEAQVKTAQQVSEERTTVELTWGVKDLDAITKGAFGGELTILAGESGGSKTSFAVQMVLANAREGTPCGVFSIEMQKEKFVRRFYPSMGTIIKAEHMRDPRLMNLHTHVPEISRLTGELSALPIYIDDSPVGIKTLCARVRMMRRKFGIKLFVIDYFQLIEPPPSSGRMESTDVKRVIFPLRDLVKAEPSIHLLVLSQYSKAEGWIKKRKRSKSDLYGGSVIHHAAQNVILITVEDAKEKQPNELLDVEFLVDKQRDGRVGKATCMFDRDHLTFTYPQPLL